MNSFQLIIAVAVAISLILNGILIWFYIRQQRFFNSFTKDISKKDLKSLLKTISLSLNQLSHQIKDNQESINTIIQANRSHFQHVGFVRFNPFSDTGGNQSFCICLLDDHQNGVLITSLHSREQTRLYAKTINKGKTDQKDFFEEEKQALKQALAN